MDGAVAANRDHMLGPLLRRRTGQLLAMTWRRGANDIHRPALRSERPGHDGLGAPCGASSRSRIEDDVGMKHAADKISSRLPRKGLQSQKRELFRQILLFPIDGEFDVATAAHHACGPAPQRDAVPAGGADSVVFADFN